MKTRKANPSKSAQVKARRGFSPEEVALGGQLVTILNHKSDPKQKIEVYRFNDYVWAVVVEDDRLVSAWPSRKLKKEYGI